MFNFIPLESCLESVVSHLLLSEEAVIAFMSGCVSFVIGYFFRFDGARLFCYITKKHSIREAIFFSIIVMSVATFIIACLPTNQMIASYGFGILVLCRILQELSSGIIYSSDGSVIDKRSILLNGSISMLRLPNVLIMVGIVFLVSIYFFPKEFWRFVFVIGGCIGLVNLFLQLSKNQKK